MKVSQYPVLDNRPIDQWKVTELKEELKRRNLTTKGLKEELIKRLDEAIRGENEAATEEVDNGADDPEPENVAEHAETVIEAGDSGEVAPKSAEEVAGDDDSKSTEVDSASPQAQVDIKDSTEQPSQDKSHGEEESGLVNEQPSGVNVLSATDMHSAAVGHLVCESLTSENVVGEQGSQDDKMEKDNEQPSGVDVLSATDMHSAAVGHQVCESLPSENAVGEQGSQDDKMERDNEDSKAQHDSEDIKPPPEDLKLDVSDPNNQVSEVSTSLGFPVKSNSISTDSLSIFEKNELKDNIIADNVKLEPDVKPEMVQPSSSNLGSDGGKSHPMDVEEPHENKVSVDEIDNNVTNSDMSQKNYSADLGSSEKLNLDRSSGDDSMEEDALESKQIDSNYNSEEVGERIEQTEVTTKDDESPVVAFSADLTPEETGTHSENKAVVAASDKRKLPDQEAVLNNEPSKRQRRWKSESSKVREPQNSNISSPAAVKDVPQSTALERNLSGLDSVHANDTPKEREVPPSTKPATTSLRIDRFLRPFTLKAVQELLAKTGSVTSFWMDHIKTHCYVTYLSVEEAVETRNALYNLQWPPNGGRHLLVEFVDSQEVQLRLQPPPQPPAPPVNASPREPSPALPQPSPRQQSLKQQMPQPPPTLPPPPALPKPAPARERAQPPPPPPPLHEKVDAPIVTLDDLFRKTKATPRIYYLPLSEEQVSAKIEGRRVKL